MAAEAFTRLIDDSNAFFAELKANNAREWFDPRKQHYDTAIKKPATFLADMLAEEFSRIAGRSFAPKVFRIYRDVRFSKDKTPFNTHLHMMWSPPGPDPFAPVFFFGSEPGDMTAGFGIMGLKGDTLARFRAFIDRHGDALEAAVAEAGMDWSDWGPPPLKRVPAPYDADHPQAALLRRKGMTISTKMDDRWRAEDGGLPTAITRQFERTLPLQRLFRDHLS